MGVDKWGVLIHTAMSTFSVNIISRVLAMTYAHEPVCGEVKYFGPFSVCAVEYPQKGTGCITMRDPSRFT